jgi:hypothetical protein
MGDTSPEMARRVRERYMAMTPEERLRICSSMFDTARALVEATLSPDLTPIERQKALCRRFYGELLARQAYEDFRER